MSKKARIEFLRNLPAALETIEQGISDAYVDAEALMESSNPKFLSAEQMAAIKQMAEMLNAADMHFATLNEIFVGEIEEADEIE